MARYVTVVPAYGATYSSNAEVKAAWEEGTDFLIQDYDLHGYISSREVTPEMEITVRYGRNGTRLCKVTKAS